MSRYGACNCSHDHNRRRILVMQMLVGDLREGRRILELLGHDLLLHSNIGTILLAVGLPRFPVDAIRLRTHDRNLCGTRLCSNLAQPVIHTIYTLFFVLVFFCIRKSTCTSALLDLAVLNLHPRLYDDLRHASSCKRMERAFPNWLTTCVGLGQMSREWATV